MTSAIMDRRKERLFARWQSAAERSVGSLAVLLSDARVLSRDWFRDKLAARMYGRMLGELVCREGGRTPVPYGDVRDALLSAGADVEDHRFASDLLEDLLVVNMPHGRYVVQDLGERGCYCEPYNPTTSREAGIPRTLRLPPESLVRFLEEFDETVPRIRAAADALGVEVRKRLRAEAILRASVEGVAAGVLGAHGIPYEFVLTGDGVEFELHTADGGTVFATIPLDRYADRIGDLPDLAGR